VNDDYDIAVRELAYEKKARPTNRLKTEEELAKEESEKLQRLERHRLRRLQGLPSDTEPSESEGSDDEDSGMGYASEKQRGGDDLECDFDLDEGEEAVKLR
jgi:nucleolar protein 14